MKLRRSLACVVGLAVVVPSAWTSSVGAETPEAVAVVKAQGWLRSQQEADGGFELADFPGFETPDAVLALASVGDGAWNPTAGRQAVEQVTRNGKDGLDQLDDLVDGEADPASVAAGARAAKIAALVAEPLGLDPSDFDPSADSGEPVDLLDRAAQHRQGDGSYDFDAQFNGVLYTALALAGDGQTVPDGLTAQIRAAQRGDGSWDYTGTGGATSDDVDTTALGLLALRAAGLGADDRDVAQAITWLASRQQPSGAWQAFGSDDPNSTSTAAVALSALHVDVTTPAWRAARGVATPGRYVSPYAWLVRDQTTSGRFLSPNDSYGLNTLPTTQSMQALGRQWVLAPEAAALGRAWSRQLASPAAAPADGRVALSSSSFPSNPSVRSQRQSGAAAVLASDAGRQSAAADLFQAAFGRTIDASGQGYWGRKLATLSRPQVLAELTGSAEFYRRAGGTTPTFVDAVYQSVLGREPDASGRAHWIAVLDRGAASRSVARSLVASSEYRRKQVTTAYTRVLGRAPATAERDYWTSRLATTRVEVLLAGLASSSEHYEALAP